MRQALDVCQLSSLNVFRNDFYHYLKSYPDTLFELVESVLTNPGPVGSLPLLSLNPVFQRKHSSLYRSLADGRFSQPDFEDLLFEASPIECPLVFGIDTTTYPRVQAKTGAERGYTYQPVVGGHLLNPGYTYSWLSQLFLTPDSWTRPLSVRRLNPLENRSGQTIVQIKDFLARLPAIASPLLVFDAGYQTQSLARGLADTNAQTLVRVRHDRIGYRSARPRRAKQLGRTKLYGRKLAFGKLSTLPAPDEILEDSKNEQPILVKAWHQVLLKTTTPTTSVVAGSMITIQRGGRAEAAWRLFWTGPVETKPDLALIWQAYAHRFDLEHNFRFTKQTLAWTKPKLKTPQQIDLWTKLFVVAQSQLRLAKPLVADYRLPWQSPLPSAKLTPGRVRQSFSRLVYLLVRPTTRPKLVKPGLGNKLGQKYQPRARYPVLKRPKPGPILLL